MDVSGEQRSINAGEGTEVLTNTPKQLCLVQEALTQGLRYCRSSSVCEHFNSLYSCVFPGIFCVRA